MSKNLTRKGLAFGALVALGSSVIAGAPAHAIDPVSLEPNAGTAYKTILGQTFTLKSLFTDAAQQAAEELKFEITDLSDKLDIAASNGTDLASATRDATSHKIVFDGNVNTFVGDTLSFKASSAALTADAAFNVTVKAWLDFDGDNTIDAGESVSAERTVSFVKLADAAPVTTLAAPVLGASTLKATLGFAADINAAQIDASTFEIVLGKLVSGSATSAATASTWSSGVAAEGQAVTFDSTNNVWTTGDVTTSSAIAEAIYTAQAVVDATNASAGAASFKTVSAAVATAATQVASTTSSVIRGAAGAFAVRTGTKTVPVFSTVTKADGDDEGTSADSVGAGVAATVTITETIDSTTTVTVGGKTVTSTTGSTTFETTTNADGKVAFDIVSSTGKAGDVIGVQVTVAGVAITTISNYTWTDATIPSTGLVDTIVGSNTPVRSVVKGSPVTIEYALVDDFGALVTDSGYRVSVSAAGNGTDATTPTAQVAFVGGKATVTFTEGSTAAGNVTVAATAQVLDTTASNYVASKAGTLLTAGRSINSTLKVLGSAVSASAVSLTAGSNTALETATFATGDRRVASTTVAAPTYSVTTNQAFSGQVTDAYGAGVAGALVTVSAAGIQFNAGDVYTVGSITVSADATGNYTVNAYSHTAGKVTFTAAVGSVTKTADVTFAAAAENSATEIVVDAPASSVPGRTVPVTVTLKDKWGNPVQTNLTGLTTRTFSVVVTGVGSTSTIPANTDSTGKLSFNLVFGTNDSGSAVVTVKYDQDAAAANGKAEITKSASVAVAAAAVVEPTSKIGTANSRVYVNVKDGKGSVVSVKIGAKWFTRSALNNDYTLSFKSVKGKKVSVKVYVDGDLSSSKTITVK